MTYAVYARSDRQSFVLILFWILSTVALAIQVRRQRRRRP